MRRRARFLRRLSCGWLTGSIDPNGTALLVVRLVSASLPVVAVAVAAGSVGSAPSKVVIVVDAIVVAVVWVVRRCVWWMRRLS